MDGGAITALVEAMRDGGGARAETFFISHGLGAAYASVGKFDGIQKRVNAALLQAQREGRQEDVVRSGLTEYGLDVAAGRGRGKRVAVGDASKVTATSRVFISHASADAELADALADLIRLGTDLSSDRILCTSLEGMDIPTGTENYLEYLREELSDAALVLPLFTPAFFDSEMCLIEIGAMWGLRQPFYPLIVPPVDFARVEKLIGKVQAARIDKEKGLSDLHDRIIGLFELPTKTGMWNTKRKQFEDKLKDLLANLAEGTRVDAGELRAARKQASKHKARVKGLRDELGSLRDQLADVTAAKTSEMLESATKPRGDIIQEFQAAAEAAQDALKSLSRGVREAVYEQMGQRELFRPEFGSDLVDDAETAVRDDLLVFDEDNNGWYLNEDDPAIEDAMRAVRELFDADWGEEVEMWFRSTYKKRLAIDVRPAWVALHLL